MPVDTLFVGIGSDHGDDRVGWLVADELKRCETAGVSVRHAKAPLDLLDWLEGVQYLAICDACQGTGPVGSWHRWRWPHVDVPFVRVASSHSLGLEDALGLASRLNILPPEVLLWGVEIGSDRPGDRLSADVVAAIAPVASDINFMFLSHQAA